MSANDFDIFQHDGHKLQACGGSTGHFIKTVAMCDSAAIANFLLTAVNAYDKQRALIETMSKTLSAVKTWAEQRCPCDNDQPNPCPLCGASVENLEACKAVDQTFPPNIKRDIFAALAAAKEQSA